MQSNTKGLKKYKDIAIGLLVCLFWFSTQIAFIIPMPGAFRGESLFFVGEILALLFGVYLVVWRWLVKGEFLRHSSLAKVMTIELAVFLLYFAARLIYRLVTHQGFGANFLVARILVVSLITYYFFDLGVVSRKSLFVALAGLATTTHAFQLYDIVFNQIIPRKLKCLATLMYTL